MPRISVHIEVSMNDDAGEWHKVSRSVTHEPSGGNPRFYGDQMREALAKGNAAIAPLIAAYDPKPTDR